jgi:hypothetical protein
VNRIKLFAAALVLCLTGAVYAAGDNTRHGSKPRAAHKASCCAAGASCCDGGSCCAAAAHKDHARLNAQASKGAEKEDCCQGGASCCKSGAGCCAAHKSADGQTAEQAGVKRADCCAGDSCDMSRKH